MAGALAGKVTVRPAQVTEADFAAAKAAGYSEDQLFELMVCAAVGQSARLHDAGLAALAEAVADEEAGSSSSARTNEANTRITRLPPGACPPTRTNLPATPLGTGRDPGDPARSCPP